MTARLVTVTLLISVTALVGQGRGPRGRGAQPGAQPETSGGAGTVVAPNQGYVVMPDPVPAGTVNPTPIPSDPMDQAFWELYDRKKEVTISGKVTRVTWTNPNTYIFVQASGIEWAVESSFVQFRQSRVDPAVRVNQTISVSGYLPKDDPNPVWPVKSSPVVASFAKAKHLIRAGAITTEYGQTLKMGQPPSPQEVAERERALLSVARGDEGKP